MHVHDVLKARLLQVATHESPDEELRVGGASFEILSVGDFVMFMLLYAADMGENFNYAGLDVIRQFAPFLEHALPAIVTSDISELGFVMSDKKSHSGPHGLCESYPVCS